MDSGNYTPYFTWSCQYPLLATYHKWYPDSVYDRGRKSKRRFITRGEAVDKPDNEAPFSPTPSYVSSPNIDTSSLTRAHTVDNPLTLTSSPMSSRSRSEVRSRTFDHPLGEYGEARDRLTQLDPRPQSFRATRRDSTGSDASLRHELSPLRTDSAASNASASTGTLVENFPGRARWHQEEVTRSPVMNARNLSSESEGFASVARKGTVPRERHKEDTSSAPSLLTTPSSPLIAHGPTRARRFVGRPSSRETAIMDDGILSSPSRGRASAGWHNTLSNIQDQELIRPRSDLALLSQSSTESKPDENLSKAERIAQYKEKRRKELASMFGGVQKAASFDTADIRGDQASYLKYRRSSSREESRTPQDKMSPPVATVSPMVTGTYSTTQSQAQSPSQYPMVTVLSPSSPIKVTADVGTSTSSVGTQTPSPTGLTKTQSKQIKQPSHTSSEDPISPPTFRRTRRDRSPIKSVQNLPTIKDARVDHERSRHLPSSSDSSKSERLRDRTRLLSPKTVDPASLDRTRILSPGASDSTNDRPERSKERSRLLSPTTSDSAVSTVSHDTSRTLTPVGYDAKAAKGKLAPSDALDKVVSPVSPAESDASSTVSSERSRHLSPTVSSNKRPTSVTLEPLSSLLPPRNVSRPSSTTPLSQMLDLPQQPPRPASVTSKPDDRNIIRPQPIRAGTVRMETLPPTKIHMRATSSKEKTDKAERTEKTDTKVKEKGRDTADLKDAKTQSQTQPTSTASTNVSTHLATTTSANTAAISTSQVSSPHVSNASTDVSASTPATSAIPSTLVKATQSQKSHTEKVTPPSNTQASSVPVTSGHPPSATSGPAAAPSASIPPSGSVQSSVSTAAQTKTTTAITSSKMAAQPSESKRESRIDSKPHKSRAAAKAKLEESKQTVHVLQSHKPIPPQSQKSKEHKEYKPLNQPAQVSKPARKKADDEKFTESAKPKLRPLFQREDSFNRPDSPPRQPIPLPKNSVIARNRRNNVSPSSSSSEVTPTPSPITSPRASRRRGPNQGAEVLLSPPTRPRHRQGKSRSRAAKKSPGRPLKDGQETTPVPVDQSAVKGSPRAKSPRAKSPTKQRQKQSQKQEEPKMGQGQSATSGHQGHGHSHGQGRGQSHAGSQGHVIDRSATLPAKTSLSQGPPQNIQKGPPLQTQESQSSQGQPEDGVSQRHIERRMSDSSSATSASRRRYRQRDSSLDSSKINPVSLRPGKKDKSSTRKSSLNSAEQNALDMGNRVREHTPISSDDGEGKRLSRYDQIQTSRAKSGVAELSLSPPPTPSGDPFQLTQDFVSERLPKSPSPITVTKYSPVKSQSSHERPGSAISPPPQSVRPAPEGRALSPEVASVPQRDVLSPGRRVVSPDTVSHGRPLSSQESLLSPGVGAIRPKSQQDYRQALSPERRPLSQQEHIRETRDPRGAPYRVQSSLSPSYQNTDVAQAYSPVIAKTGPLSPVRGQAGPTWPSQPEGPTSPVQRQPVPHSGPLSPTQQSTTAPQMSRTHIPPPLHIPSGTMHDRGALSPANRGPMSPTGATLSPSRQVMSPGPLMSPTQTISPGTVAAVNSQAIQPPLRNRAISPLSPVRGYEPGSGPLPRSVSVESGPRSPVPAPVVFPSPRPVSSHSEAGKPKFVPYTMSDLEDAYKQKAPTETAPRERPVSIILPTSPLPAPAAMQSSGGSTVVVFQAPEPKQQTGQPVSQTPQTQPQPPQVPHVTQQSSSTKSQAPQQTKVTPQSTVAAPQKTQATPQQTSVAQPQKQVATQQTVTTPQQTAPAVLQKQTAPHQTTVIPQKTTVVQQSAPAVKPVTTITKEETIIEARVEQKPSSDSEDKVEATINKLQRSSDSPGKEDVLPNLRRGSRDVSELVRRFSSDVSDREGSPSNRGDSALLRRTPDRTQSFRQQREKTPPPENFIRAKSFREKKNGAELDVADQQLKEILKRRSRNYDAWEEKVASQSPDLDKVTEEESKKFESRFKTAHSPSPALIDSELNSRLQVRREKEDRESGESQQSSESESNIKNSQQTPKSRVVSIKTQKTDRKTDIRKAEPAKAKATVEVRKVETKLQVPSTTSSSGSSGSSKLQVPSTTSSSGSSGSSGKVSTQSSEPETDTPSSGSHKAEAEIKPENVKTVEKAPVTQVKMETKTDVKPKEPLVSPPVKKMTNETTTSVIKVAPVVKKPKDSPNATTSSVSTTQVAVSQDKLPERATSSQLLKLRPAMNDVTNIQRSSRTIELTRSESLRDQDRDRPPLRKTQTVDLGGLEGERAACNLLEFGPPVRRRSIHSPTPETEPQGAEKETKRVSVAERIFHMEVQRDDGYTPLSGTSGAMTPRVIKLRTSAGPSGTVSPRKTQTQPPMTLTSTPQNIVNDQLMARLGDMAVLQEAAMRRQGQGQRRSHHDARTRTQPVTLEEVQQASALESVSAFRAEVSKNTLINAFKKSKTVHPVYREKGQETMPQPFQKRNLKERRNNKRYQTQPITMEELGEIPELQPLTIPERPKRRTLFAAEASDSDLELDRLVQVNYNKLTGQRKTLTIMGQQTSADKSDTADKDKPEAQDEYSKLSVLEKMSLFRKMEDQKPSMTPRSKRRFLDRKKRLERSRTQPITEEELTQASEIAAAENGTKEEVDKDKEAQVEEADKVDSIQAAVSSDNVSKMDLAEDGTIDELSRMSLAEKMKLFSESKTSEETKRDAPVLRRKARRTQSRFKTQPVTMEEVEKAKISPLAATMIKPADPELLQNMSVKDQRAFMAEYAKANFKVATITKQSSTEEPPSSHVQQKSNGEIAVSAVTSSAPSSVTTTTTITTSTMESAAPQVISDADADDKAEDKQLGSKKEELRKHRQKQLEQRLQDSSTEDETFDKIQRIKNEAIARRRRMMEMRKAEARLVI